MLLSRVPAPIDGSVLATLGDLEPGSAPYRATITSRLSDGRVPSNAGWQALLDLLRGLLAEVSLQVGEVPLGGAQFGFGVAETGLFFLDAFNNP